MSEKEEVIAVAGNSNDTIFIKSGQYMRFRCTNCEKRKIHCLAGGKLDEPIELLKDRCTNDNCECMCKTHYLANNGRMRKYGLIDDTTSLEDFTQITPRNETDDIIDKLNKDFKGEHT